MRYVFCGDVVDYGPSPVACLHWVRKHCEHAVRGNHDNALAFNLDCHCMGSFRVYSRATRAWHQRLLADDDFDFLRQMPLVEWFEWNGSNRLKLWCDSKSNGSEPRRRVRRASS